MYYLDEINVRQSEIIELKNYLNDTDYQTLREFEGGEKMSEEVKNRRSEARLRINVLQSEISEFEARMQEEEQENVIPIEEQI